MTRPKAVAHPGLYDLVKTLRGLWFGPYGMLVTGDAEIFPALAPAVAPGPNQKLPGYEHFERTIAPIVVGYLNPGDGSYGARIREDHTGLSPELLGMSVAWHMLILSKIARQGNQEWLIPDLIVGARVLAYDIGGDPDQVTDPEAEHKMMQRFGGTTIMGVQRDAFWEVMGYGPIRKAIGTKKTDADILNEIGVFAPLIPDTFTAQFARG